MLGALAGGWSTYRVESQRQSFERRRDLNAELRELEREAAVMRGIARVWRLKLDDFRHFLVHFGDPESGEPRWWLDQYEVDTEIAVDDMKLVAAAATNKQWERIDFALYGVRAVRGARAYENAGGGTALTYEDREIVREAIADLEDGITALDELSERQSREILGE